MRVARSPGEPLHVLRRWPNLHLGRLAAIQPGRRVKRVTRTPTDKRSGRRLVEQPEEDEGGDRDREDPEGELARRDDAGFAAGEASFLFQLEALLVLALDEDLSQYLARPRRGFGSHHHVDRTRHVVATGSKRDPVQHAGDV